MDSGTLNQVLQVTGNWVETQAGAYWEDVTRATLPSGLTPPLLGTCPWLSVGGLLSAGGFSNSSHRLGGIVDSVLALEVVTGHGELVSCSMDQNRELCEMVLGGMGQIGLMVSARIQAVPAPETLVRQDLIYEDLAAFLADAEQLALEAPYDHLTSRALRKSNGEWCYTINVGRFYYPGQQPEWFLTPDRSLAPVRSLTNDKLHFQFKTEPFRASYTDYLYREAAKNIQEKAKRQGNPVRDPSLVLFIPASGTREFMAELLATPAFLSGLADFQFNPFNVRRFHRPLFRFPDQLDEDVAFGVWLYPRSVALDDAATYEAATAGNREMVAQMRSMGGKIYPAYAPHTSPAEWEEHYGPEIWPRLAAAKQEYDPNHVLTPTLGMFTG